MTAVTHLPWCDPSRCSPPVHEGGVEAHRSAPIRFGAHSGYLYQIRSGGLGSQYLILTAASGAELNIAVADLRLLVAFIAELNARTYSAPEVAKVAAALLSPDEEE